MTGVKYHKIRNTNIHTMTVYMFCTWLRSGIWIGSWTLGIQNMQK